MVNKKVFGFICSILAVSILLAVYASAITGSMGNARMILRVNAGDTIEKTILVKNVNDVPLNIELSASGDLANYTKILDDNFTLEPGSEKDARFSIKVPRNGTTETRINVKFSPEGSGNGVGLISTVIVIAEGEGEYWMGYNSNTDESSDNTIDNINLGENVLTVVNAVKNISGIAILGIITSIVLIIFLVLLIILYKKSKKAKKKRYDRSS